MSRYPVNEKDRLYRLTVTLEVMVCATSEELAIDHCEMIMNETVLKPGTFGAVEVLEWDVK